MNPRVAVVALVAWLAAVWCGLATASAQPATQKIDGTRFEALAKPIAHAVHLTGDSAITQAFSVPDQLVPQGALSLAAGNAMATSAYISVPIRISVDAHYIRTIFVGYRVQQFVTTAVAAHDLVPDSVIAASDLTMARVPFSGQRPNGMDALVGRRVSSAFRAGQPLYIEETQANQIVKPGASVVLIVQGDGVSVVADVIARTGGGLGDQVMVWNPETHKMLSATVTAPDRVELDISGGTQ